MMTWREERGGGRREGGREEGREEGKLVVIQEYIHVQSQFSTSIWRGLVFKMYTCRNNLSPITM